jgi:hypothetical protein
VFLDSAQRSILIEEHMARGELPAAALAILSVIVLLALMYVGSRGPLALGTWFPWKAAMKRTLR